MCLCYPVYYLSDPTESGGASVLEFLCPQHTECPVVLSPFGVQTQTGYGECNQRAVTSCSHTTTTLTLYPYTYMHTLSVTETCTEYRRVYGKYVCVEKASSSVFGACHILKTKSQDKSDPLTQVVEILFIICISWSSYYYRSMLLNCQFYPFKIGFTFVQIT